VHGRNAVGGRPAGLYFAATAKLHNKNHDFTVVECDPTE
jgi:hypothetical protein